MRLPIDDRHDAAVADDIAAPALDAAATALRGLADMIEQANGRLSVDIAWSMYRALNQVAGNLETARQIHDMRCALAPLLRGVPDLPRP